MARSYERSLLIRGGFSCFSDTPIGKPRGWVLVTVGVCLEGEPRHVIRCHEREYFEYY